MILPRAAVVVLTWNAGELARRAVASVLASTAVDVELVVVEASSDAGSRRVLDELEGEGVRLLRLATNTGFARGMNTGYAATTAPLVTLLNCDGCSTPTRWQRPPPRWPRTPRWAWWCRTWEARSHRAVAVLGAARGRDRLRRRRPGPGPAGAGDGGARRQ